MPALYALSAFVMTLAGGAFAFRYQRYLLYIMAFSSGLVIGVAFLDLIPEVTEAAFHEGIPIRALMVTVVIGFLAIFLLEKLTIIHSEKQHDAPGHHHNVGLVGASDLLPQVHERPKGALIISTIVGLLVAGVTVYAIQSPA